MATFLCPHKVHVAMYIVWAVWNKALGWYREQSSLLCACLGGMGPLKGT